MPFYKILLKTTTFFIVISLCYSLSSNLILSHNFFFCVSLDQIAYIPNDIRAPIAPIAAPTPKVAAVMAADAAKIPASIAPVAIAAIVID